MNFIAKPSIQIVIKMASGLGIKIDNGVELDEAFNFELKGEEVKR